MWLRARVARIAPVAGRWGEVAPACCNACRTCTAANVLAVAGMLGSALVRPFGRRSAKTSAGS
jgi:hypothetical protein